MEVVRTSHRMSRLVRALSASILFFLCAALLFPAPGLAAPIKPQLQVTGYVITADLAPAEHHLTATAAVTFTALEDLTSATFELNNGLQITKLIDASGKPLQSERLT